MINANGADFIAHGMAIGYGALGLILACHEILSSPKATRSAALPIAATLATSGLLFILLGTGLLSQIGP